MTTKKKRAASRRTRKNTLFKSDSFLFFDDDLLRNIQPFRDNFPKIKSIHVKADKPYVQILCKKPDFYYPVMFLKKYKENRYAQKLVKGLDLSHATNICDQCLNVTNQGITISQMRDIVKWASATSNNDRTVIFDLDNTLTVCNVVLSPGLDGVEEIAQYFSGNIDRYNALLLMFFHLRKNGVACKILTNNGWADKEYEGFPFFVKLMQVFDPRMTEDDVIYGNNDKVQVFKNHHEMMRRYKALV